MPRRLPLLVASLLLAACTITPGGLSEQQLGSSLPSAAELGRGWSLVGTTTERPQDGGWDDALTDAASGEAACRDALTALDEVQAQPEAARFARSVYRSPSTGASADRDLTLTIETFDSVPDRARAVRAMTTACSNPQARLETRAGIRTVTITVSPHEGEAGGTGYSVEYETDGLAYFFDYVVAGRDRALITASVTGPTSAANQEVLQRAVTSAGANLDRARGNAPT